MQTKLGSNTTSLTRLVLLNSQYAKVEDRTYQIVDWLELLDLLADPSRLHIQKDQRQIAFGIAEKQRPLNQPKFYKLWNGFQAIDIDFKCKELAEWAKQNLAKLLGNMPWVWAIAKSSGGGGLHIFTWSMPPWDEQLSQQDLKTYYYRLFEQKLVIVHKALVLLHRQALEIFDERLANELHPLLNQGSINKNTGRPQVLDTSQAKLSQPLLLTCDPKLFVNPKAKLTKLALQDGESLYKDTDKWGLDSLKTDMDRKLGRSNDLQLIDWESVAQLKQMPPKHRLPALNLKNEGRYQLAYSLANLLDAKVNSAISQHGEELFLAICSGNPKWRKEQSQWRSIWQSAVQRHQTNSAPISGWVVKMLKEAGAKFVWQNTAELATIVGPEAVRDLNSQDQIIAHINSDPVFDDRLKWQPDKIIKLGSKEWLSDKQNDIEFSVGVTMLIAPPGTGKTRLITDLMEAGDKRIILAQPYTSVLQSKFEQTSIKAFWGAERPDIANHRAAAMTFDKFAQLDHDTLNMLFDLVVIDESHLLTSSSFRGLVPGQCLDLLQRLHIPIVLMTATPIMEHMFIEIDQTIQIIKTEPQDRQFNFVLCKNSSDRLAKMGQHIAAAIEDGRRILFPTNEGNEWSQRVLGAAATFLGRKPKGKYYKREYQLHQFLQQINREATIGDVEVLFCTSYLSVGVDINDLAGFDIIYADVFTGPEIEQFNCRLRNVPIRSWAYIMQEKANGDPINLTLYQPFDLSLTEEEVFSFQDLYQLHVIQAKRMSEYDFFQWVFKAPYFVYNRHDGSITIHETCYRLDLAEQRWRSWANQLPILRQYLELYGYATKVLLDPAADIRLQNAAREAAKQMVADWRRNKYAAIESFIMLIDSEEAFSHLCQVNWQNIKEGKTAQLGKTSKDEPALICPNPTIFRQWQRHLRILQRHYTWATAQELLSHAQTKQGWSIGKLSKITDIVQLFGKARTDSMAASNLKLLQWLIDKVWQGNRKVRISNDDLDKIVWGIVEQYTSQTIGKAKSQTFSDRLFRRAKYLFDLIAEHHDGVWQWRQLPPFDQKAVQEADSWRGIVAELFHDFSELAAKADQNSLQQQLNSLVFKLDNVAYEPSKWITAPEGDGIEKDWQVLEPWSSKEPETNNAATKADTAGSNPFGDLLDNLNL